MRSVLRTGLLNEPTIRRFKPDFEAEVACGVVAPGSARRWRAVFGGPPKTSSVQICSRGQEGQKSVTRVWASRPNQHAGRVRSPCLFRSPVQYRTIRLARRMDKNRRVLQHQNQARLAVGRILRPTPDHLALWSAALRAGAFRLFCQNGPGRRPALRRPCQVARPVTIAGGAKSR